MAFGRGHKPATASFVLLALVLAMAVPADAGILDFLFGGSQPRSNTATEGNAVAPADNLAGPHTMPVARNYVQAPRVANRQSFFCVRLCDGRYFPIDNISNATPLDRCQAMCPTSETKIFSGSEIDHAIARDGTRYADLGTAYIYRQHLIPSCTCNGKDPLGLARIETSSDPTLRPGDIIATETGLKVYAGKHGESLTAAPSDTTTKINSANGGVRTIQRLTASNIGRE